MAVAIGIMYFINRQVNRKAAKAVAPQPAREILEDVYAIE